MSCRGVFNIRAVKTKNSGVSEKGSKVGDEVLRLRPTVTAGPEDL